MREKKQWEINKQAYNNAYNKEHSKLIRIRLFEKDYKYVEIWQSIPNKTDWFRKKLDEYAKENGLG